MEPAISHYLELRKNRSGQQIAYLVGTRIRVQDLVSDYEIHGFSPDEIVREYPQLSLAQVHAALSYYFDHRDTIRGQIKLDVEYVEKLNGSVSGSLGSSMQDTDAAGDQVSS